MVRGSKMKKDANAPKRPKSGFFQFTGVARPQLVAANPALKLGEIGKKLGEAWSHPQRHAMLRLSPSSQHVTTTHTPVIHRLPNLRGNSDDFELVYFRTSVLDCIPQRFVTELGALGFETAAWGWWAVKLDRLAPPQTPHGEELLAALRRGDPPPIGTQEYAVFVGNCVGIPHRWMIATEEQLSDHIRQDLLQDMAAFVAHMRSQSTRGMNHWTDLADMGWANNGMWVDRRGVGDRHPLQSVIVDKGGGHVVVGHPNLSTMREMFLLAAAGDSSFIQVYETSFVHPDDKSRVYFPSSGMPFREWNALPLNARA